MHESLESLVTYSIPNNLSSSAGNGALLDDDSARFRSNGYISGSTLKCNHVRSSTSTYTGHLGRCVDAQEDDIRLRDTLRNIRGEEQVLLASWHLDCEVSFHKDFGSICAITSYSDNLVETGLMDGRVL